MNEKIAHRTCGSCKHAAPAGQGRVECRALPPVPILMSAQPRSDGRVMMNVELVRPNMERAYPACDVHYEFSLQTEMAAVPLPAGLVRAG